MAKLKREYHVFGNKWDDYFTSWKEAVKFYKKHTGDVRLYEEISDENGLVEENCLMKKGSYPY